MKLTRRALLFNTICVAAACAFAQNKQTPPPPGPPRPFVFPKYETKKLPNGLTVFAIEDHRQPLVSYVLLVDAGAIRDTPKQAGVANMTAAMLRQGTTSRSAEDLARIVDTAGGNLDASTTADEANISATFLKSDADLALDLLSDIVLHPAFHQEELDRQRQQALSGLHIEYSDAQYLAMHSFNRASFGPHPYGFPMEGTPETLGAMTRDNLVAFHAAHYHPANAYLAVAGDLTPAEAFAKAEKYLGAWKTTGAAESSLPTVPAPQSSVLIIDKPDAVQTQIIVGQVGIARNDPDYIPLQIANQILGGSFNSRINMKLRAKEGLTYGANSRVQSYRSAGLITINTFTRTEKTGLAIQMIADLLKEFAANPSTPAEMSEAKAFMVGSFGINNETAGAVAGSILTAATNGLPPDYWQTYRDKVQSTTPEQVAEAVRRHWQVGKVLITVAGNASQFSKDLAAFGPVKIIPAAQIDLTAENLMKAPTMPPSKTPAN